MAFYNQNFESVSLDAGYTANTETSVVHQILCLTNGAIIVKPQGGGNFTWTATSGQTIDVLIGKCTVSSGSFVGFKSHHQQTQQPPYYK